MTGNVWVVAEQWKGAVTDATRELLAIGRDLADGLGVRLEAVLIGHGVRGRAASLAPADAVLHVDLPVLADAAGPAVSRAVATLAAARGPSVILVATTNASWDLLGQLAALLGAPFVNLCRAVAVDDGTLRVDSLLYGGTMTVSVTVRPGPVVLAMLPGAGSSTPVPGAGEPAVDDVAVDVDADPGVRLLDYQEPESGDVDITRQDVLVAVGRGIGNKADLEVAEDLASALGGAVCGSRPVIDQGWLPLARQVGKSGLTVKPRLYVAAGVSGAPEHVEGMKDSEVIVAINTDPGAPIFAVADYGIVDDAAEVLEALAEAVRKRKG